MLINAILSNKRRQCNIYVAIVERKDSVFLFVMQTTLLYKVVGIANSKVIDTLSK